MSMIVTRSKLIGTKDGVQLWLLHLECDTMQDVPAATVFGSGTKIAIGSTAHVIEDNSDLQINSSGVWIQQRAGSSTYTRAEIDTFLSAINAENTSQQAEINYAINTGSKNTLLITNTNNTLVVNGITFTKNADQTITATGTATENADYALNTYQALIIGQKYTLSGCPTGGGVDNFLLRQLGGAIDYGDGVTFTAESSSANFYIRIRNGYAIQGSLTFKPMLRPAAITDQTFEPYSPTNRELYQMILALSSP